MDMAELLRDNIELERRRDTQEVSSSAFGLNQQPNRREVPDLLSWVQCFGMYAVVLSSSYPEKVHEIYAYQTMIMREARRCGGKGWLSYDHVSPTCCRPSYGLVETKQLPICNYFSSVTKREREDVCPLHGNRPCVQ